LSVYKREAHQLSTQHRTSYRDRAYKKHAPIEVENPTALIIAKMEFNALLLLSNLELLRERARTVRLRTRFIAATPVKTMQGLIETLVPHVDKRMRIRRMRHALRAIRQSC